jgi:uncharacterized damage-inducible protein DinB
LIRGLYDYHRWANRRLFDIALARGEEPLERDMGPQWSFPSVRRMFAHIYGADALWLTRWKGASPSVVPGGDIPSMTALRARWDTLEEEQRAFLDALTDADLGRVVQYKNTEGRPFHAPLAQLLQHVPNHATHHRSEICTMLTLSGGSPPDTGLNTFILATSGQS